MVVSWPQEKRQRLCAAIQSLYEECRARADGSVPVRLVAKILGLARNGGYVLSLALFIILRLQYALNDKVRERFGSAFVHDYTRPGSTRKWWGRQRIRLPQDVWEDIAWLLEILEPNVAHSRFWTHRIGLIIRRMPEYILESDASYEGMGGLSWQFCFMWRLTTLDLQALGFPVDILHATSVYDASRQLHINVLEFIAIIINVWFALFFAQRSDPSCSRDWIIQCLADNMSALSWQLHAACISTGIVRRLGRFLQALVTNTPLHLQLQGDHIEGKKNENPDLLSRPESRAPLWESVISQGEGDLSRLCPYQVPPELLSTLLGIINGASIGVRCETRMTKLLTVEPKILPAGWRQSMSQPLTTSL
jgi:hypothetical protein